MRKIILFLSFVFCIIPATGQIRFAPIFTDNMVIQQNDSVLIWGTFPSNQKVELITSWFPKDTLRTTTDAMCRWKFKIKTPTADGVAHTIKCNSSILRNVVLGEVWLCSGQSNMAWSAASKIVDGEKEAAMATYPFIRLFRVPNRAAETPQNFLEGGSWTSCTPETMWTTSAIGYFFAKKIHQDLNVPIGIILSAWGGANAETFTPIEVFDSTMLANVTVDPHPYRPHEPAVLYNQMIHPLVPFTLAGILWYQGEANCMPWAAHYEKLLVEMIKAWRQKFQNQKLPFYSVQIAPYNYKEKAAWAPIVRQAQERATKAVGNAGLVVVSDLVDDINDVHPQMKKEVGLRLANFALAEVYDRNIKDYKSPTLAKTQPKGNIVIVLFENATDKLICKGQSIDGLKILNFDGKWCDAKGKIVGNRLEVWADVVDKPIGVSYCFDHCSTGNLYSAAGLPVAPFQTKF